MMYEQPVRRNVSGMSWSGEYVNAAVRHTMEFDHGGWVDSEKPPVAARRLRGCYCLLGLA
jgi:hypothetical protein